jgi:hypothetical protein
MHRGTQFWVWKKLREAINLEAFYYFFLLSFSKSTTFSVFLKEKERKETTKVCIDPFSSDLNCPGCNTLLTSARFLCRFAISP